MKLDLTSEAAILESSYRIIRGSGKLMEQELAKLSKQFGERLTNALELVKKKAVKKYVFSPSGRVIWTVRGRKSEYQVIPETNFCSCDDFYFRVMDRKKELCYHVLAQKIAEALGKFERGPALDRNYEKLTAKWHVPEGPRRKH